MDSSQNNTSFNIDEFLGNIPTLGEMNSFDMTSSGSNEGFCQNPNALQMSDEDFDAFWNEYIHPQTHEQQQLAGGQGGNATNDNLVPASSGFVDPQLPDIDFGSFDEILIGTQFENPQLTKTSLDEQLLQDPSQSADNGEELLNPEFQESLDAPIALPPNGRFEQQSPESQHFWPAHDHEATRQYVPDDHNKPPTLPIEAETSDNFFANFKTRIISEIGEVSLKYGSFEEAEKARVAINCTHPDLDVTQDNSFPTTPAQCRLYCQMLIGSMSPVQPVKGEKFDTELDSQEQVAWQIFNCIEQYWKNGGAQENKQLRRDAPKYFEQGFFQHVKDVASFLKDCETNAPKCMKPYGDPKARFIADPQTFVARAASNKKVNNYRGDIQKSYEYKMIKELKNARNGRSASPVEGIAGQTGQFLAAPSLLLHNKPVSRKRDHDKVARDQNDFDAQPSAKRMAQTLRPTQRAESGQVPQAIPGVAGPAIPIGFRTTSFPFPQRTSQYLQRSALQNRGVNGNMAAQNVQASSRVQTYQASLVANAAKLNAPATPNRTDAPNKENIPPGNLRYN